MIGFEITRALRIQRAVCRGSRCIAALYGLGLDFELAFTRSRASISFAGGVPVMAANCTEGEDLRWALTVGSARSGVSFWISSGGEVQWAPGSELDPGDFAWIGDELQTAAIGPMMVGVLFGRVIPAVLSALEADGDHAYGDAFGVVMFVASGGSVGIGGLELTADDEESFDGADVVPGPSAATSAFGKRTRFRVFDPSERALVRRRSIDSESEDDDFFREGEDGYRTLDPFPRSRALAVDGLRDCAPHFGAVWDEVGAMSTAAAAARVPLRLDPILILGPAGVGKTWAVNRMREVLGLEGEIISMAGTSLNEVIQGGHPSWKGAAPGLVAKLFSRIETANPLVCVDEFDKITAHQWRGDPYAPYYALLEPEGSSTFVDEFLSVHFQTRHVSWLFTANDVRVVPDLILDRVKVIEVDRPDREQMRRMARAMTISAHGHYGEWFDGFEPGDDLLDALSELSPRRSRLAYSSAMAKAVASKRHGVSVDDLPVRPRERRAGFLS